MSNKLFYNDDIINATVSTLSDIILILMYQMITKRYFFNIR